MSRKLVILLIIAAILLPATIPSMAQETEKLVVASFYPVDAVSGWQGLIDSFKETHPNVEIEVQVTPFDQYMAKILSQIAGGDAPDIIGVENTPFPQFVENNMLTPLNSYLDATEGFSTEDIFPHLLDRYTYDGVIYGIPYDAQPSALLYYNPAIFDELGLDYPTSDMTWDDLLEIGEQLKSVADDGEVERYALCGGDWRYWLLAGGGAEVDDLREPTKTLLDEPAAVEAIQFYVDLMHKYQLMPTPQTLDAIGSQACPTFLIQGKVAMMIDGFWQAVEHPEDFAEMGIGLAMGPVKDVETRNYPTGGTAYGIVTTSENKDLAWEFLTAFLGPEGYAAAYEEATLGAIYPPAHIPSFEWYQSQDLPFVDTIAPNAEALDYITFAPYMKEWPDTRSRCIDPDMDLISRGDKPVAETLATIAECVNSELE